MNLYVGMAIAALSLLVSPVVVEARGGGYGGHYHQGGWYGGYHNNFNNHYHGWGGYGPGYYTGGPVGYYNTQNGCKLKRICPRLAHYYWKKFCPLN